MVVSTGSTFLVSTTRAESSLPLSIADMICLATGTWIGHKTPVTNFLPRGTWIGHKTTVTNFFKPKLLLKRVTSNPTSLKSMECNKDQIWKWARMKAL